MKYMEIKMEDVIISNYSVDSDGDAQPDGGDTFDFTSEPTTAPDVAIYNGFEVINSTSLDGTVRCGSYGDGGFIILG